MRDDIVDQILAADFGEATRTVAFRLLRMAGENGQVNLTWTIFCRICDTPSIPSARRHLTDLAKAGLIHYSTNDYVYVTFKAFLRVGSQNLRTGTQILAPDGSAGEPVGDAAGEPETENAKGFANSAHGFANFANGRAVSSYAGGGWLVGSNPDPCEDQDQPTNHPAHATAPKLEPGVAELLADPLIGLNGPAVRAAMGLPLEEALLICLRWRADFDTGRCDGVGALLHRLRQRWRPPSLTEMDRQHELYRRHGGALERERYFPAEYRDVIKGWQEDGDEEDGDAATAGG